MKTEVCSIMQGPGEHPAGEGEGRRQIREELVSEGVFIFVTTCSLQNPGDGGCWEDV